MTDAQQDDVIHSIVILRTKIAELEECYTAARMELTQVISSYKPANALNDNKALLSILKDIIDTTTEPNIKNMACLALCTIKPINSQT